MLQRRTFRIRITLPVALLVGVLSCAVNVWAQGVSPRPYSKEAIVGLLKGAVSPKRIAVLARQRGIDFQITPKVESELRRAGATAELLATLREVAPKPPAPQIEMPRRVQDMLPPPGLRTDAWFITIPDYEKTIVGDDDCYLDDYPSSPKCKHPISQDLIIVPKTGAIYLDPVMWVFSEATFPEKPDRNHPMRYRTNFKFSVFIRLMTNTKVKDGDFKRVRIDAIVPGAATPTDPDALRALSSIGQAVALPGGRLVFPAIAPTPDLEGQWLLDMIRQINRCDKKSVYGIHCPDENVVAIERDFLMNSPAVSLAGQFYLDLPDFKPYLK
ncbi:MAG: hypothetical protein ABSE93_05870 [Terriglobia bacterium]|jgi:hypothetical protein